MSQSFLISYTKIKTAFVALGLLGAALLTGCDSLTPSTSPEATPTSATTQGQPSPDLQAETPKSSNAPTKTVNLADIVGTTEDGWLPKAIAQHSFKRGMKPEAVGQLVPGAEKISEFGISEVAVKDIPGIEKFKFSFLEEKEDPQKAKTLYSVTLLFDPALKQTYSYEDLAQAFAQKYGKVDSEEIKKKIVTWVGPDFVTAQLTDSITKLEGYQFQVVVPKP